MSKFFKESGFTLVEMVIVVAIIIILTMIIMPGYSSSRQSLALERSAVQFSQDIRKAQELALSSRESSKCANKYTYGVFIDKNNLDRYSIFTDCDGDGIFDANELIEQEFLERNISFNSISSNINIVFIPPKPDVLINPVTETISITLKNQKGGTKTVKVNKIGLIEVE